MLPSRMARVGAALLLIALTSTGHGRTLPDLLGDLRSALKDTSASPTDRTNEDLLRRLSVSLLPDQAGNTSGSRVREGVQTLTQVSAQTRSDKVRQVCQALIKQAQAEAQQRETELITRADDIVKRTGETALQAKTDKDLDPTLQEIGRLQDSRDDSASEVSRRANDKLRAAYQFVQRWQGYLAQQAAGNPDAALRLLNQVTNDTSYPIVPRSEILSRTQGLMEAKTKLADEARSPVTSKMSAICISVNVPGDIAPALEELRNLRQQFPRDTDSSVLQELERLDVTYKQIRAGMDVAIGLPTENSRFTDLRLRLFLLSLPHRLGLPDDFRPSAIETAGAFLDRVMASARKTGNWPLLLKAVEAPRALAGGGYDASANALKAFIVGQNEERAGQYASAVVSYHSALLDVGDLVPMNVVRDRMAAIKQEHPAEYEAGTQRALNPPAPAYPPGYPVGPRFPVPGSPDNPAGRAMPFGTPASPPQPPAPTGIRRTPLPGQ